jgi:hypothetical protein
VEEGFDIDLEPGWGLGVGGAHRSDEIARILGGGRHDVPSAVSLSVRSLEVGEQLRRRRRWSCSPKTPHVCEDSVSTVSGGLDPMTVPEICARS